MSESARIVLVPLGAPGERLSNEQLSMRAQLQEKRLRLLIPEPSRADIRVSTELTAQGDQVMLEVRMESLPQMELTLDDVSMQPVAAMIAQEVAMIASRIEASQVAIYARIDDESSPPLSPRQVSQLRTFGGTAVHLELPTGPFDQRFPDEPMPIDETPRAYSAQINAHFKESVLISRVVEETERGAVPVPAQNGQLALILLREEGEATDALHREVAEIFVEGRNRRLRFVGRAQTLRSSGKTRRIIFERLSEKEN